MSYRNMDEKNSSVAFRYVSTWTTLERRGERRQRGFLYQLWGPGLLFNDHRILSAHTIEDRRAKTVKRMRSVVVQDALLQGIVAPGAERKRA